MTKRKGALARFALDAKGKLLTHIVSSSVPLAEAVASNLNLREVVILHIDEVRRSRPAHPKRPVALIITLDSDVSECTLYLKARLSEDPDCRWLAANVSPTEAAIVTAFAAGAHGVTTSMEPLSAIGDALDEILRAGFRSPKRSMTPDDVKYLAGLSRDAQGIADKVVLSPRERVILDGIHRAETNKEIAGRLGIELQTVKNHVTQLFRKLNVHSRYEAARIAEVYKRHYSVR